MAKSIFKSNVRPYEKGPKARAHRIFVYFLLILFSLIALLPFYYLVITACKSFVEASTKATMWPETFALFENIEFVVTYSKYNVVRMFLNTMFIAVMKTVGTVLTCSMAAYGFSFYKFPGKKAIFFILLSALMLPGELLGIPIFEFWVNSGLREVAYLPLWLAAWFGTDISAIFLFRQFFNGMPKGLIEAARVDGASEFAIYFKIILPNNVPVISTVVILCFVGTYNDLYGPALYISGQENWVMANSISIFENYYSVGTSNSLVPWNYVSVACIIALIPVIVFFALLQKRFMESVAGVGIKG
jgi:multiple sugar transport system permease protein